MQHVEVGRDRPARKLRAAAVERVHLAGGGCDHDVEHAVAVEVGKRGGAVAGSREVERKAGFAIRVGLHRDHARILADVPEVVGDAQAQRDVVDLVELVAVGHR